MRQSIWLLTPTIKHHQVSKACIIIEKWGAPNRQSVTIPVQDALKTRHVTFDDVLDLVRQLRLDLLLQSAQQERPQHFVQTPDDQDRFFFVQFDLESSQKHIKFIYFIEAFLFIFYQQAEPILLVDTVRPCPGLSVQPVH